MLTHLCQPRKLPTREACEAEATLSPLVTCEYVWHNRTRVCDLREPGSTSSARSSRSSHAREALHRCIRSHRTRGSSLVNVTRPLDGGVAIVESMTSNMFSAAGVPLKEEHQRTTHNIRCWAARHNYSLILNGVSLAELRQGYSTAYGPRRLWGGVPFDKINDVRHRVTRQALERYEAVLHIDTDTIALNENRSLRRHLHGPGLMTFQIREMCARITRAHMPRGRGCTHTRRNNAHRLTFRPRAHAPPIQTYICTPRPVPCMLLPHVRCNRAPLLTRRTACDRLPRACAQWRGRCSHVPGTPIARGCLLPRSLGPDGAPHASEPTADAQHGQRGECPIDRICAHFCRA